MAARYLVTGGAGMVGAMVVRRLLARGDEAVVVDTGQAAGFDAIDGTGAEVLTVDVSNTAAYEHRLRGVAAVIHLAANASVSGSIENPIDGFASDVEGSFRLLDASRRAGVGRFIFASSSSVVSGHAPPMHEGLVPWPVSPYGAGKAAIEAYLRSYSAAYGMATAALRFSNAYGPWSAHKSSVVPAFVRAYCEGGPLIVRGDGRQTRDFVHVEDVATAVLLAADGIRDGCGEVYQVGSGVETSILDVARLVFELGGHELPIVHEPPSNGDVPRSVADISKARAELGYRPEVALREGVSSTLGWYQDRQRS